MNMRQSILSTMEDCSFLVSDLYSSQHMPDISSDELFIRSLCTINTSSKQTNSYISPCAVTARRDCHGLDDRNFVDEILPFQLNVRTVKIVQNEFTDGNH